MKHINSLKVATFEKAEENMDSEDGIQNIIELIFIKIRGFIQNQENKELWGLLKIVLSIFNSFEKIYCTLFEKDGKGKRWLE